MTMIVTALSDASVVQIVDRRLTKGGALYDDLANKAICGVCADARFSIAYTGLMMTPIRTDEWITNLLSNGSTLAQPLPTVLDALAEALTQEFQRFKHLPEQQRRLTLAVAGFGKPGPFAAAISNQEDERGQVLAQPGDRFRPWIMFRNKKKMNRLDLVFHGAEAAIDDDLTRIIGKMRRALFRKPGVRIASALVAIVRRAARHPMHGHLISSNCVCVIHSASNAAIQCEDYFSGQRSHVHLPHFVSPKLAFKHVWIKTG